MPANTLGVGVGVGGVGVVSAVTSMLPTYKVVGLNLNPGMK